ncbi:MAG: GNAT family N-acetyltransferase [Clostridia bacterium]|nr:GNAT family N-acetyltransferase [Clostridia bacterium]
MIEIASKKQFEECYKNYKFSSNEEECQYKLYKEIFDNPKVDALLVYYIENSKYIGECVLVFKDKRKELEFLCEYDLVNIPKVCMMKNLCIYEEENRGKGYFTKFLKEIENLVKEKQFNSIIISVSTNNTHAIDVYKHLGFIEMDKKKYKDTGDMIVMKKELEGK